jgi:hypothetical protein
MSLILIMTKVGEAGMASTPRERKCSPIFGYPLRR